MPPPAADADLIGLIQDTTAALMYYETIACVYDPESKNEYRSVCLTWLDKLDLLEYWMNDDISKGKYSLLWYRV